MHRLGSFPGATASVLATWFQAGDMRPTCLLTRHRMRLHELLPIIKWLLLKYHSWPSFGDSFLLTKAGSFFFPPQEACFPLSTMWFFPLVILYVNSIKVSGFFLRFAVVQTFLQPLGNLLLSVKSFLA